MDMKAMGEVRLDDRKDGVECDETAVGAVTGGWRSVWARSINFEIAADAPDSYADGPNPSSSGECQFHTAKTRSRHC
jgi:hypothetical protein